MITVQKAGVEVPLFDDAETAPVVFNVNGLRFSAQFFERFVASLPGAVLATADGAVLVLGQSQDNGALGINLVRGPLVVAPEVAPAEKAKGQLVGLDGRRIS